MPLSKEASQALEDFPSKITVGVQWGEQDAFQHVNATVYFRWFENARIAYMSHFDSEMTMGLGAIGPILASIKCDYKRQIKYPDTVHIGTKVGEIGRSSIQVMHAVYSEAHNAIAALGDSTIVILNYETGKPQRVPDSLREQIAELQS